MGIDQKPSLGDIGGGRRKIVIAPQTKDAEAGMSAPDTSLPASTEAVRNDEHNLTVATSIERIDRLNAGFYGEFPFPWRPGFFTQAIDTDIWRKFLCQDIGDWSHQAVPKPFNIWVAGCGTNQAVITALKFQNAQVVGSDLSESSLGLAADSARQLGIRNLTLRRESLNDVKYEQEFDYIISTGVIHHNFDPGHALSRISAALKPSGILELMVYNRYHRILTSAFQKATRILAEQGGPVTDTGQFDIAKKLVDDYPVNNLMGTWLRDYKNVPDAQFADALIQPMEYSYTVESLNELANRCRLEIVSPCSNQFDRAGAVIGWNLNLSPSPVKKMYDDLPDIRRWQVTNLLAQEQSPLLWFYLRRIDGNIRPQTESEMCAGFLSSSFVPNDRRQKMFVLNGDRYEASASTVPMATKSEDASIKALMNAVKPGVKMHELMRQCRIPDDFASVNSLRIQLTTSSFARLIAEE